MNRRTFIATAAALPIAGRLNAAIDQEYARTLLRLYSERPATLSSSSRIAHPGEPGPPLEIHGTLFDTAGRAPMQDAVVFAYHTDNSGLYNRVDRPLTWRLRGWARTDPGGKFHFATIRPAPYPTRSVPAHVHFAVFTKSGNAGAGELRFADDPLIQAPERATSSSAGAFGRVREPQLRDGVQHVDLALKFDTTWAF